MDRYVAAEFRTGKLAAAVGYHFVDVHVELRTATSHPDVQGKHVMMLARQDFVANLNDQFVALVVESFAAVVGNRGPLFEGCIGGDHFAGDQIRPDAEMVKRALRLCAPEFVGGHFNNAETVSLI